MIDYIVNVCHSKQLSVRLHWECTYLLNYLCNKFIFFNKFILLKLFLPFYSILIYFSNRDNKFKGEFKVFLTKKLFKMSFSSIFRYHFKIEYFWHLVHVTIYWEIMQRIEMLYVKRRYCNPGQLLNVSWVSEVVLGVGSYIK